MFSFLCRYQDWFALPEQKIWPELAADDYSQAFTGAVEHFLHLLRPIHRKSLMIYINEEYVFT